MGRLFQRASDSEQLQGGVVVKWPTSSKTALGLNVAANWGLQCGVSVFFQYLHGFSLGTPVSSHSTKFCRLGQLVTINCS